MKRYLLNEKGQALIEIMVALAVMVIVILALVQVTTISIRNATFAKNRALATKYTQEWIEEARKSRDEDLDNFFVIDFCDSWDNDPNGKEIFDRDRDCTLDVGGEIMTVEVTVSWTDAVGPHESRLETHLTNWK